MTNTNSKIVRRNDECFSQFLGRWIQHQYRKNIKTQIVNKKGPDNAPTFTVKLILPKNIGEYVAIGSSKQEAVNKASEQALNQLGVAY